MSSNGRSLDAVEGRCKICDGASFSGLQLFAAQDAPLPVLGEGGAQDEPLDRGEAPRRGAVASH